MLRQNTGEVISMSAHSNQKEHHLQPKIIQCIKDERAGCMPIGGGRDALVYDLMELARPAVDDRVLAFLEATSFRAGDFTRVSDGSCRLHPQLARAVVVACGVAQSRVIDHAKWLLSLLLR